MRTKEETVRLSIASGIIFFSGMLFLAKVDWKILVGVFLVMWANNITNRL